ncbi:glutaredoxin family protein [Kocuria flava]|uniref:glutaredoxin family protein n=1 Tax=Kocuria flava TaxID=446860 RepID=UPI001FF1E6B1|nr:glutaredoxin family protein [Kocuria flava]MCJ8503584.1 glutaredoxin family protein [Kocuria flava]
MSTLPAAPAVTLLTRPGCHLCEAARAAVARVTGDLGLGWTELDVDQDPELARRHAEEIPVVLVDGVPRDFWQIDERRLARLLRERLAG